MNSYELSRDFWDFAFENPEKIKPNHCAIYFFAIEHCNRLGWKEKFGFPTTMVMDAVGIKSYNTFLNGLNELVEFGFIKMIERSKNQYSANIIALSKFDKALDKALDKAFIKHDTKQSESTVQSIDSINKPIYNKTINNNTDIVQKFLNWFNQKIKQHKNVLGKFSSLTKTDLNNLKKLQDAKFTNEDFDHAFNMMYLSDWVIENNMAIPSHYLRNDNFQKYLNTQIKTDETKIYDPLVEAMKLELERSKNRNQ